MKSIVLFVATSLILVSTIVLIALPNTVQADKPNTKYCIDGGPYCGENKTNCKALLEGTVEAHKCLEVTID